MIKTLCNFFFPKPEVRDVIVVRYYFSEGSGYSMSLFESVSPTFDWVRRQEIMFVVLDYKDTYLWRV